MPLVNWYESKVMAKVDKATDKLLTELALQIKGQAQVNITQNDQIDTGFMLNSGYVVAPGEDTYGAIGQVGDRIAASKVEPAEHEALVGFAADYSIYQEMKKSFLYKAAEAVAKNAGGAVEVAAKEFKG